MTSYPHSHGRRAQHWSSSWTRFARLLLRRIIRGSLQLSTEWHLQLCVLQPHQIPADMSHVWWKTKACLIICFLCIQTETQSVTPWQLRTTAMKEDILKSSKGSSLNVHTYSDCSVHHHSADGEHQQRDGESNTGILCVGKNMESVWKAG